MYVYYLQIHRNCPEIFFLSGGEHFTAEIEIEHSQILEVAGFVHGSDDETNRMMSSAVN